MLKRAGIGGPGAALLAALLAAGTAGCPGDDGGGTAQEEPEEKKADTGPLEKIPSVDDTAVEQGEKYSYNSIGKRDPFRSFIQKEVVVVNEGGPVGPLQMHEIDDYTLRGIVWNIQAPRALVEDPDGIGHVVELGTLIGKNWGKVTQIKPGEIIITEEYRDPIENQLIINEVTMRLPAPEEERKR